MRRILAALFTVFLLSTAFADEGKLKIGVSLPLSGEVAPMGLAFRRGLDLYSKDFPLSALQFTYEDHRYDGKSALSALHKLHKVDNTALQIVWGNMPGDTCAPIAEQNHIPLIAISMNPVAKGRKYVVSLGPPTDKLLAEAAKKLEEWKVGHAAAVSIDIGNALEALEMLKTKLRGALKITKIANEENDFKTLIMKLKSADVDGLFLLMLPRQAITFLRQSKQLDFHPKIIGGDVFADMEFQKEAAQYTDELFYVYGATDETFVSRLKNEMGTGSYFFEAATGYSLGMILEQTAVKAEGRGEMLQELGSVSTAGAPLTGLRLLRTLEYGLHFETQGAIYKAVR